MAVTAPPHGTGADQEETEVRTRILDAAFAAFMKNGYAATSTLEIATRARVSKRDLYAQVGNKQEMLIACIGARARRLQIAAELPVPRDRDTLAEVLTGFGTQVVREVTTPTVIAVYRLAIAEAVRAPAVAQALDSIGRAATRTALRQIMVQARTAGLLRGEPVELAEQFSGLLWGNLMIGLLLKVVERPNPRQIAIRAREATTAFLRLHRPAPAAFGRS